MGLWVRLFFVNCARFQISTTMARDNLFLGQARGKIGDIVFYRMNGVQMSRTRNRNPRNPDTNPQKVQRAISATVSQLYRAGRRIFDHSFQGKSVGAKNQHYFLSENMRILRSLVSSEIDIRPDGVTAQLVNVMGRVVMPGATTPVGFDGCLMSQGDYQQNFFSVAEAYTPSPLEDGTPLTFTIPAAASAAETCAEYAERTGLIAGDIYTICGVEQGNKILGGYDDQFGLQGWFWEGQFFAVRLRVIPAFLVSTEAVTGKKLSDMMMIDLTIGDHLDTTTLMAKTVGSTFTLLDVGDRVNTNNFDADGVWGNIIRSRLDRDLRSTTYMRQNKVYMSHGIIPGYLINAWTKDINTIGNSDLILEGGEGYRSLKSLERLPTLTAAAIAAIPLGQSIIGVVMGTFVVGTTAYTNPVVAVEHMNGHPAIINAVVDSEDNYEWSADIYGNLIRGNNEPGEDLSVVVAPYLAAKFPSSNIEPGAQVVNNSPTLVFSI